MLNCAGKAIRLEKDKKNEEDEILIPLSSLTLAISLIVDRSSTVRFQALLIEHCGFYFFCQDYIILEFVSSMHPLVRTGSDSKFK